MKDTHTFTCIGKGHGAPALPATREDWEQLRNEPWLAEMCRRILNGDERLKSRLPIWTPVCAAFKNNHRSVADALMPLNRLMLDFDEKGHSQEILARSLALKAEGKWNVLLVEESVRRGTHVLITLPEGMTPQEAQQQFSEDVGFQADPALKDVARCIYMVPASHTLFVDDALFAPQAVIQSEAKDLGDTAQLEEDAHESSFPDTYEGIPYSSIVQTLEEQMGGQPEHGSRNNFIFSMACHLRYVCNDDSAWISQVLPTYGESRSKWLASIKSACARSQNKSMPRIMKRTLQICKERQSVATSGVETLTAAEPPKMPRNLPPLIRLLVSKTPQIYRPAVAHAVFPALATHLWRTTFRYIDNVEHEATLMCCLMAGTGAGKNCISEPINHILADIRKRDSENMQREKEWKKEMQTKGASKDKRTRPEGLVIQEIDADMTNAAFVQRLADAEERFLYAKMNEI
ncbi:MAG: VirE protein, partial [Bacteroidaceae bacterium]|nr:VirE protein [Bacteroidaceae bacterium]